MADNAPLPDEIRKKVIGENVVEEEEADDIFEKFMRPLLGLKSEDYANQAAFYLNLERRPDRKWPKPYRRKQKKLSYLERRKLGLYSLGRESMKYEDLLPLHSLWKDYLRKYINFDELKGQGSEDRSSEPAGVKLYRADYHGAELLVKRSLCPGYVGKSGIVAMETKNCFVLVGKDNITRKIPKATCEFSFQVDKFQFSFFGKNFISRPAERSSRKIKTIHPSYL